MGEWMGEIDAYLSSFDEAGLEAKPPGEPPTEPQDKPPEDGGVRLKDAPPAKPPGGVKLKVPGTITMILVFILFLVFAISPAYPGSKMTRLQLLLAVILKGGSMRDPSVTGSLQSLESLPDNGTSGTDYTFAPIYNMGTYVGGGLTG